MGLVTVDLDCTAGNNTSLTSSPTKVLDVIGASVATKVSTPSRTLSVTVTTVPRLLKLPKKVFSISRSTLVGIFAERFGISRFDELICYRNWFIAEPDNLRRWVISARQRFIIAVRGRR